MLIKVEKICIYVFELFMNCDGLSKNDGGCMFCESCWLELDLLFDVFVFLLVLLLFDLELVLIVLVLVFFVCVWWIVILWIKLGDIFIVNNIYLKFFNNGF